MFFDIFVMLLATLFEHLSISDDSICCNCCCFCEFLTVGTFVWEQLSTRIFCQSTFVTCGFENTGTFEPFFGVFIGGLREGRRRRVQGWTEGWRWYFGYSRRWGRDGEDGFLGLQKPRGMGIGPIGEWRERNRRSVVGFFGFSFVFRFFNSFFFLWFLNFGFFFFVSYYFNIFNLT